MYVFYFLLELHHIMLDSRFRSLFVVLCYEGGGPYVCSFAQLMTVVDKGPGVIATRSFRTKYLAHVQQPQGLESCIWLFSPPPRSSYEFCMVPAYYPGDAPLHGARFDCSKKTSQPIKPPKAHKFGGHVVTVGKNIYFMALPYVYGLIPGGHAFERYIPDKDVWEDLPFPKEGFVALGPESNIAASAVWDDHTILLNMGGCQIWAYNVLKCKWYHVFVQDKNNNRCYDIVGEGFFVNNIIYALSKQSFKTVLALSIQKKEVDGDLRYSCSLRSEISVPAMNEIQDEGAYRKTMHFVHLGEDNFCLVQSCEYPFEVLCQPIHLTSLKLRGEDKMVVTNISIHWFENWSEELFDVGDENMHQFRVGLCFFQPEGMTTAFAFKQSGKRFLFDPCNGVVSSEEDKTGSDSELDHSGEEENLFYTLSLTADEDDDDDEEEGRLNRGRENLSPSMEESPKHTCLKLEIPTHTRDSESIFVKGAWYPSRFVLAITDGLDSWTCNASEDEVKDRASQWDQPVSEYIDLAEKYLGFQQPGSVYGFSDAGNGHKRLTWTFEKEGTKLEWRWKCQPSAMAQKTTASVLDFLMDSNIQISEEVIRKTDAFGKLKAEAEKRIAQSERLASEKASLEAELRDLKERLSKQKGAVASALPNKTESFDEESNDEEGSTDYAQTGTTKEVSRGTSQATSASRARGQKRK